MHYADGLQRRPDSQLETFDFVQYVDCWQCGSSTGEVTSIHIAPFRDNGRSDSCTKSSAEQQQATDMNAGILLQHSAKRTAYADCSSTSTQAGDASSNKRRLRLLRF